MENLEQIKPERLMRPTRNAIVTKSLEHSPQSIYG
jgi:hypothetical protein